MVMWNEPPHGAQDFIDENYNLHDQVTVIQDGGGLVEKYQYFVMKYNEKGNLEVRIKGECNSACTMSLGVKNVCVYPEAKLQWHYAYNYDTGEVVKSVTDQMLSVLPKNVARAVDGKLTRGYNKKATLTGAQLIKLGVRECEEN